MKKMKKYIAKFNFAQPHNLATHLRDRLANPLNAIRKI